jgi:predicted RNase H-like HicB family nuclease
MNVRRYPVIIEQTGTGFSAYSPDVPGCVAAGDTQEETRSNFQHALAEHFEAMREIAETIPEPHSSVDYVELSA